jgi:prepilin-type N-terminal cleavage/methylation domain-containing protein/prepilin-type processing-associated H-X9-DG protein
VRRKGFTLIELLTVIAIIIVLAAFLFPVLAKSREKAREAECISNIKQAALGLIMYKDDYDHTWPMNDVPAMRSGQYDKAGSVPIKNHDGNPQYYYWFTYIYPYLKSKSAITCPSAGSGNGDPGCHDHWMALDYNVCTIGTSLVSTDDSQYDTHNQGKLGKKIDTCGYMYNPFVAQMCQTLNGGNSFAVVGANNPANPDPPSIPATKDAYFVNFDNKYILWDTEYPSSCVTNSCDADNRNLGIACRHNLGANYAYADGHAKWNSFGSEGIPGLAEFKAQGGNCWDDRYWASLGKGANDCGPNSCLRHFNRSFVPEMTDTRSGS